MTLFGIELEREGERFDLLDPGEAEQANALASIIFQRFEKELDFAIVLGLTRTAKAGEEAVQEGLSDRFTIRRRSFLEKGIVIDPATKAVPEASIISRDDFLARHELGGIKRPRQGKSLAIPQEGLIAPSRVLPARLRPRNILGRSTIFPMEIEGHEGTLRVIAQRQRRKRKRESSRNRRERLGLLRLSAADRQEGATRQPGRIRFRRDRFGRFAGGVGVVRGGRFHDPRRARGLRTPLRKEDRGLRILYVLTPRAELEPRGFFVPVIEEAIEGTFGDEVSKQLFSELFLGGGAIRSSLSRA